MSRSCVQLPEISCEPVGQAALFSPREFAGIILRLFIVTNRPVSGGSAAGHSQIGVPSRTLGASMAASALTDRLSPHEKTNATPEIAPVSSSMTDLTTCIEWLLSRQCGFGCRPTLRAVTSLKSYESRGQRKRCRRLVLCVRVVRKGQLRRAERSIRYERPFLRAFRTSRRGLVIQAASTLGDIGAIYLSGKPSCSSDATAICPDDLGVLEWWGWTVIVVPRP